MTSERGAAQDSAGELLQRLVNLVSHRAGRTFELMSSAAVTVQQVVMLSRIDQLGEASLARAAQRASMSLPAASQMIERMVRQGLVSRVEDRGDRRRKTISLTAMARTLLSRIEAARAAEYDLGLASVEPALRGDLALLLEKIIAQIGHARPAPADARQGSRCGKRPP